MTWFPHETAGLLSAPVTTGCGFCAAGRGGVPAAPAPLAPIANAAIARMLAENILFMTRRLLI